MSSPAVAGRLWVCSAAVCCALQESVALILVHHHHHCRESCGPPPCPVSPSIPIQKKCPTVSVGYTPKSGSTLIPLLPSLGTVLGASAVYCCRVCGGNEPGQSNTVSLTSPLFLLSTPLSLSPPRQSASYAAGGGGG